MGKFPNICASLLIGLSVLGQPAWSEDSAPSQNAPAPATTSGETPSDEEPVSAKTEDSAAKEASSKESTTPITIIQAGSKMPEKVRPERTPSAPDSATKAPTSADAQTTPAPESAPEWHRLQTRLSGSLCIACLKELESKLKGVYGVQFTRVEKAPVQYNSSISPELGGWANGVIVYDAKKLPLDDLRSIIKQNGYHPFRVVDAYVSPSDADLKFRR